MERADETVIVTRGLRKEYDMGAETVYALRGVDIEIRRNEFIAVMGPSGSGKSTLLNLVGCLDTPTAGEYVLNGSPVQDLDDNELARIRNREIGVRKAMGARQRDIMMQFLAESSFVCLLGAGVGILLGLGLGKLVERLSPLPASTPPWALATAIGLGLIVGLSSGIYPARRASRLNPIDALRYE